MKSWKSLIIPFVILVFLIIGVIVFFAVDAAKNSVDSTDTTTVNALYVGITDVKTITVSSSDPSFPQVRIDVVKNDDGSQTYEYNGSDFDPEVYYSQIEMLAYVSVLTDYSSAVIVSENASMSEFGLEVPKYTVIIESVSGNTSKVSFGNISYSGESCYIRIDGGSTVYSVSVNKYDYVSNKSIDFIDTSVLSIDTGNLTGVELIRKTDDLTLSAVCSTDDSGKVTYAFTDPVNLGSSTYFDSLIDQICALQITEFIEIEDTDLALYNLEDPEYHFILTESGGNKTEIFLSENTGGYYYGYVLGNENYFSISEVQITGLELPSVQYVAPYVSDYQASEISTLKGTYNGKTFEFKIETDSNGSISGEDADVSLDGRNAKVFNSDGRSYCAVLFESFACMEIGGIDADAVVDTGSEPVMILDYTTTQYETHTISFYQRSDNSYYVVKDGEYMKIFVYAKALFNDGGTDTYDYGVWAAYELLKTSIDQNVNGVYDIPEEAA